MPNPPDGLAWLLEEEIAPSGEVRRSLEPRLPNLGQGDDDRPLNDLRVHRTLRGDLPEGHERRIEANKAIRIIPGGLFEKYRVMLRDDGVTAIIKVDDDVAVNQYDDLLPGGNESEEYCPVSGLFSIMFDVVPALPVEIYLYAGRYARPK